MLTFWSKQIDCAYRRGNACCTSGKLCKQASARHICPCDVCIPGKLVLRSMDTSHWYLRRFATCRSCRRLRYQKTVVTVDSITTWLSTDRSKWIFVKLGERLNSGAAVNPGQPFEPENAWPVESAVWSSPRGKIENRGGAPGDCQPGQRNRSLLLLLLPHRATLNLG